ncbi:hypothetical protein [Chamaesiphon sp.]|uniref:hypothetical protein n=1 Tax=Chamaesiphon sp. TaxID=2814140 RepID=UPI0035947EC8
MIKLKKKDIAFLKKTDRLEYKAIDALVTSGVCNVDEDDDHWLATLGRPHYPDFVISGGFGFIEDCIQELSGILPNGNWDLAKITSDCKLYGFADGVCWGIIHSSVLENWVRQQEIEIKWM